MSTPIDVGICIMKPDGPWRFDPDILKPLIADRWPQVSFRPPSRATSCRWYIDLPYSPGRFLYGFICPSGTQVGVQGDAADSIPFILWLLKAVPQEVELGLADYHDPTDFFPITRETSATAIVPFCGSRS